MQGQCCPISREMVDETIVRLNALVVLVLALAYLVLGHLWIPVLLLGDFFIRAFWRQRYSPVRYISALVQKTFKGQPRMVNAAPKVFAARVGFFCVAVILLCALIPGAGMVSRAFLVILMICAALESLFKYCVGCTMYTWYVRFFPPK